MGTSAVPALIDALFTAATTALPNVLVLDGYGSTDDPGDFLMIGVEDPDSDAGARSASSKQEWAQVGHVARDEIGTITCAALSWNGNDNQKAARDAAYAITTAVENLLRATPALGVSTVLWTSFGGDQDLTQIQDKGGALALLVFTIGFQARI